MTLGQRTRRTEPEARAWRPVPFRPVPDRPRRPGALGGNDGPGPRSASMPPWQTSIGVRRLDAVLDLPGSGLDAGTAIGEDTLASLVQAPRADVANALETLRRAHLVSLSVSSHSRLAGTVEPYHDRVREAVYGHLDSDARRALHRTLARAALVQAALVRTRRLHRLPRGCA